MDLPQFTAGMISRQINRWFLWGTLFLLPFVSVLSYIYSPHYVLYDAAGIVITAIVCMYGLREDYNSGNVFRAYQHSNSRTVSQILLIFFAVISIPLSIHVGLLFTPVIAFLMLMSIVVYDSVYKYGLTVFFFLSMVASLLMHVYDDHEEWYSFTPPQLEIWLYGLIAGVAVVNTVIVGYILNRWKSVTREIEKDYRDLEQLKHRQDEIYAIIGHELRTPASVVQMLLSEVLDKGDRRQPSQQVQEAFDNIEHLLAVLDDMKISMNSSIVRQIAAPQRKINVYEIIQRSINGLVQLAEKNGVNIELKGDNCSNATFIGSGKAIQQVILNITKNAIIHSGGKNVVVDIRTRNEVVKTRFDIIISDDGKGISSEFQKKMWEPFTRGATQASGSGLGLNICRDLAVNMPDGDLTYSIDLYGGSIFTFTFSLLGVASEVDEEDNIPNHVNGKHVLFVEDTATLRMLGCSILKKNGATVVEAENGIEGLHQYEVGEFDMIFTDISMPEMNGYEFVKEVRKRGFKGPIIGITGATVGREADTLIECGANAVTSKPMRIEAINTRLDDILNS